MKNKTAKKQKPVVLNGLLYFSGDDGSEDYESLCLLPRPYTHSAGVLVNLLMTLSGKKASVRYYISDNPIESEDAVSEAYFSTLTGAVDALYLVNYSDYTGYLWTDENLKVGGHDLMAELKNYAGKYLLLVAEIEKDLVAE